MKRHQDYDPARAKELIREAGYPRGRGFPRQEMWLRAPNPTIKRVSEAIMAMLKENIGVDVTIRAADRTMYMNNMYNWRMNLGPNRVLRGLPGPSQHARHDLAHAAARLRTVGLDDGEFDRLVEEAASELNKERRRELYLEAEEIMVTDYAGAFLFHPVNLELRKRWVKGIPENPDGTVGAMDYTRVYISR